jgi:exodeoxyribonuclease VII large subunit
LTRPAPPATHATVDTHLDVPFARKDEAKALGARFDGSARKWYVPKGLYLEPFAQWLPAATRASLVAADAAAPSTDLPGAPRSVPLSRLLAAVGQVVSKSFADGIWTTAEVSQVTVRGGHVYLELVEQDAAGTQTARARGMIWSRTATTILPAFERATGAVLAAGMKVMVRARPSVAPRFGLSLEIDAIDPSYTLGDMEARRREIRERLRREGVFDANRRLAAPWDFRAVLVVAPPEAAGLGDFAAESVRLERAGLCRFVVVHSRFQGEGAAAEVRRALETALGEWPRREPPDAVVVIRGGGAVNDLAWLDDYALARFVCDCPVPVFTGIGHQRDSTIVDEVAHRSFDTPSKVILGIEEVIRTRADEARAFFEAIANRARRGVDRGRAALERDRQRLAADARSALQEARAGADRSMSLVQTASVRALRRGHEASRDAMEDVRLVALGTTMRLREDVPLLLETVRGEARASLREAAARSERDLQSLVTTARLDARRARADAAARIAELGGLARRSLHQAATGAEAAFREISGQGPARTLGRGFALVTRSDGRALTRASDVAPGETIEVTLRDGSLRARVEDTGSPDPDDGTRDMTGGPRR